MSTYPSDNQEHQFKQLLNWSLAKSSCARYVISALLFSRIAVSRPKTNSSCSTSCKCTRKPLYSSTDGMCSCLLWTFRSSFTAGKLLWDDCIVQTGSGRRVHTIAQGALWITSFFILTHGEVCRSRCSEWTGNGLKLLALNGWTATGK